MENECRKFVTGFIEDIWNNRRFEMLAEYLHPNFIDHSLPNGFQNASGLRIYLAELDKNIVHNTVIENIIIEQDFVVIRVKITLTPVLQPGIARHCHIHDEVLTGHRILAFCEQRIVGHWEFFADAH